jgi:hypothetical protein
LYKIFNYLYVYRCHFRMATFKNCDHLNQNRIIVQILRLSAQELRPFPGKFSPSCMDIGDDREDCQHEGNQHLLLHVVEKGIHRAYRILAHIAAELACWICTQKRIDPFRQHVRFCGLAFPYRKHAPPRRLERLLVGPVPPLISFQLWTPIIRAGFGDMRLYAAPVLMPETAPNFDDPMEPGKHQIGLAGESCNMEPITETHSVHKPPHDDFGSRIGAADAPHVL